MKMVYTYLKMFHMEDIHIQKLEAPEEYLIDTTPHEITISEEQTRVIVTNEKAPETGDIAVMMVTSIAVVSVIGIAFVMIKNKRKTNE